MQPSDTPDPWASLAESLGVGPGSEPQPQRPSPSPQPVAPRSPAAPKAKGPPPSATSWDALASDLGIGGQPADVPPARPPAESARRGAELERRGERRPPREERRTDRAGREDRPRVAEPVAARDARDTEPRDLDGDRFVRAADAGSEVADGGGVPPDGGDERGERSARRRRGRRGGRGRRDRDAGPDAVSRGSGREAGPPRDRDEQRRADDVFAADAPADDRRSDRVSDRDDTVADDRPPVAGDGDRDRDRDRDGDRDGDRPRRRRRRGRRGGRGRSRSAAEGGDAPPVDRDQGGERESGRADRLDDEPVPTSYGMRSPARGSESRDQSSERRSDAGSSRGRRRRRRGGEGRATAGESGRGRSRSRRGADERSSSSRSSRVRRADFAPVSGTYDEDDEGLEFLGVEEAGRTVGRRESRGDDDVLAQSGLDNVREVPSWVEAIGIVIAGNLDARSRGRGDGSRRDR